MLLLHPSTISLLCLLHQFEGKIPINGNLVKAQETPGTTNSFLLLKT
jgi:hypothetical protein